MVSGEGVIPVSQLVWTLLTLGRRFRMHSISAWYLIRIDFRSPILVITFFFYKREVVELHAT